MRVNEPIVVNGVVAIPVGATAWVEVTSVDGTGAAGERGRLSARVPHVDTPSCSLLISDQQGSEGKANTAGVAMGVLSFGLAGLLIKGGDARLRAGDILVGYVQPATSPPPLSWWALHTCVTKSGIRLIASFDQPVHRDH